MSLTSFLMGMLTGLSLAMFLVFAYAFWINRPRSPRARK